MSSPDSESVEEDENLNVIPINRAFSDGNSDFWPTDPKYREVDDTVYRQKLAARWMMEMGAYVNGMLYSVAIYYYSVSLLSEYTRANKYSFG